MESKGLVLFPLLLFAFSLTSSLSMQWLAKIQYVPLKVPRNFQLNLFLVRKFLLLTFKSLLSREKLSRLGDFPHVFQDTLSLKSLKSCPTKADREIFLILKAYQKVLLLTFKGPVSLSRLRDFPHIFQPDRQISFSC